MRLDNRPQNVIAHKALAREIRRMGFLRATEKVRRFARGFGVLSVLVGGNSVVLTDQAAAKPRTIQVTEQRNLRFGKIAVPQYGERVVGTDGSVRDTGIMSAGSADTGPASFIVTYDRGNESKKVLTIEVQLGISTGEFSSGGIQANLRNLTSDIPGHSMISEGQPVTIRLPNCRTRVCRTEFTIGATLQVTNTSGGGEVVIPTYLDVAVIRID